MEDILEKNIRKICYLTIFLSFFLLSCSQNNVGKFETEGSIANYENSMVMGTSDPAAVTLFLFNDIVNFYRFNLNDFEKKTHTTAIMFALDQAKNGQTVSWHNKKRFSHGKVRVMLSKFNKKGEFCRVFDSYIFLNGAERGTTNTACKNLENNSWVFFK